MVFENNDNGMGNNSIFDSPSDVNSKDAGALNGVNGTGYSETSFITKFFESVSGILKAQKDKNLLKKADEMIEESGSFLNLLNNFGCKISVCVDFIDISCEELKLAGRTTVNEKKELVFDENTKTILTYIANVINRTNSLHDIITKYEEQGFYPIGELEKEKAIINGQECEVLVGKLENSDKEQKTIYYYNGQELFLGEEQ